MDRHELGEMFKHDYAELKAAYTRILCEVNETNRDLLIGELNILSKEIINRYSSGIITYPYQKVPEKLYVYLSYSIQKFKDGSIIQNNGTGCYSDMEIMLLVEGLSLLPK